MQCSNTVVTVKNRLIKVKDYAVATLNCALRTRTYVHSVWNLSVHCVWWYYLKFLSGAAI